jgi:ubiquinone/menaquinone biosynthesis C-methylase UbiE/uncharacterized protein YbaR (Trm112 family)
MMTSLASDSTALRTLRCPQCLGQLNWQDSAVTNDAEKLECADCQTTYPVTRGIPRLLLSPLREALLGNGAIDIDTARQVQTALSFGFEWQRFPEMYQEWQRQFLDYMQPHRAEFFPGKKVLDAGCGNGRFAYYAGKYGAEVWAVDLGPAVEVARHNTRDLDNVKVIQADLHHLPFSLESFDFIYSIGVLHHLPDPRQGFTNLLRYLKPGGEIQIYLYWTATGQPLKRALLAAVTAARRVTTRLPHSLLYALAFPAAVAAFALLVWPYQILRRIPGLATLAEKIPMKQYASFPFRVCVNDQFDRFSAPIENRYTKEEVVGWLMQAGLEEPQVSACYGWIGTARKPLANVSDS